ncbi:MAG: response regulator [Paraburkholderia tropica]|jgi:two-component system, OmpR family, phosphate regulon response regulator OmpR|uniref:Two component transcriptional regulator, winged helix family n=2 Tax=Burkholderiales TaxID=80840 RepID=A0AAQ1JSS9_9BURK|nr:MULTISPECIES: response regulator [Paraburkholderia]MBN3810814.1 response regulator [Paraburkholderia sp. Ac-20347]MDE1144475.1 response regulator [Paraburkholderia tropica]PXX17367.1 winged helix family two component transcriptional regulator [Paraburkholderia tropica]PZW84548.1 winged helix family two component transcriptional regulator [Paraburkholderia tropica]QNB15145.1 response regulator [Paraburkholderia tropica]
MSPHVLIVDDDPVVRDLLSRFLRANGFEASVLHDGTHLGQRLERERPAVVVLDVMMPGTDGLRALAALRAKGDDIPVIFASARGAVADRIAGLTLGADDYVAKPFDPQELLLRIQTVLRRRGAVPAGAPEARERCRFGPFELDFTTRTLLRDGERVALRDGEFALLKVFTRHPYRVLSRVLIHDLLHADGLEFHERSLDVPIWRLRRVIEDDPSQPRFVQTVRGKGYVFVPLREGEAADTDAHGAEDAQDPDGGA